MEKDLFRKEKGTLTKEQMSRVDFIKTEAEKLKDYLIEGFDNPKLNVDQRCLNNALEKLEEAVMWATKGYTKTNKGE